MTCTVVVGRLGKHCHGYILPDLPAVDSFSCQHQGNEIADALAKAGADDASVPSAPLTYLELFSRAKGRTKTIWLIP
ncbi:hypothetical protein AVEN_201512-1, partial [Araneus ventricosus]